MQGYRTYFVIWVLIKVHKISFPIETARSKFVCVIMYVYMNKHSLWMNVGMRMNTVKCSLT